MLIDTPTYAGLVQTSSSYLPARSTFISRHAAHQLVETARTAGQLRTDHTTEGPALADAVTGLLGEHYGAAPATMLVRTSRPDTVARTDVLIVGVDAAVVQTAVGAHKLRTTAHSDVVAIIAP